MKVYDYIVVGCGLASIAFCEQLRANNRSFVVFDDASQKSSLVAAGLYNPVVLKRFTPVWQAKTQLELALPGYQVIEADLGVHLDYKLQLLRRLASIEEQNLWFTALDKTLLAPYLSPQLIKDKLPYIDAPYAYGEVWHAGRLDTKTLVHGYKAYLKTQDCLIEARFDYQALESRSTGLAYKTISAQHLVFAEGYGITKNPYFKHLPIAGTKGEILTIKAPDLRLAAALKSSVFVIPLGDDLYTVGATYHRGTPSNEPTEAAQLELLSKFKAFVSCDFEVVNHAAGIRPTVKDRRPIVGRHPQHNNVYVLNGLGSRGVMIAPYAAKQLYDFIETQKPLDAVINSDRFSV